MFKNLVILFFLFPSLVFAQAPFKVTNQGQHPYKHLPIDQNVTGSAASDGQCLSYDSATKLFEWKSCITLSDSGNVGIGTVNYVPVYVGISTLGPSNMVHVAGNIGIGTTTPEAGFVVTNGNVGIGTWTTGGALNVFGGNVGIGTVTAPQLLYVAGTIEGQGFKLNQNASAGYVLVSSSVGIGTWMSTGTLPATLPGGGLNAVQYNSPLGSFAGSESVFSFNGTNIGIGTTNGTVLFDVRGQGYFSGNLGIGTTANQASFSVVGGNVGLGTITADGGRLIVASGNVGIGSVWPGTILDVQGTGRFSTAVNTPALSNLTTNGFVTTTGGTGTLSVDTASYVPTTRTITVAGTANQITSSAGAQDLSANRTWTLSTPQDIATTSAVQFGNVGIGTSLTGTASLTAMNGNVGIGTWKPATALEVVGTANATTLQQGGTGVVLTTRTLTGGTGIAAIGDLSSDRTITFDSTEVNSLTWGNGSFTTMTFDAGATDPVLTAASNSLNVSTGNLGVGSASPGQKLDVFGAIRLTGTDNFITNGNWLSGDGGDEGVFVASDSNVGIGITGPSQKLHVYVATGNLSPLFESDGTDSEILLTTTNDARSWGFGVRTTDRFAIIDNTAGEERVTVSTAGNVGIGSAVPGQVLDVNGNIRSGAGTAAAPAVVGRTAGNTTGIYYPAANEVAFSTNGVERVRIDAGGNVGIGATSMSYSQVVQRSGATDAAMLVGATGTGAAYFFVDAANGDGSGGDYTIVRQNDDLTMDIATFVNAGNMRLWAGSNSNNNQMVLTTGGNVGIGSATPGMTLDVQGEIRVSGVTGSGKAVCIKSTGDFGVCSDAVGAGGTCTCG